MARTFEEYREEALQRLRQITELASISTAINNRTTQGLAIEYLVNVLAQQANYVETVRTHTSGYYRRMRKGDILLENGIEIVF